MTWRHGILVVALVILAVTMQISVLTRLGLPGATPDLLTVIVVSLALLLGSGPGASIGFAAGLAIDLAPPSDGSIGIMAMTLAVIGYAAGSVSLPQDRPVLPALGVVILAAPVAIIGSAALASLLGSARIAWDTIPSMALSSLIYAAFMAPFVVPGVWFLAQRISPSRPRL